MWVKTDDGAPLHPKFFRAGVAAYGWWHAAISYCNRWLTDGFLPERDLDLVFPGTPHEATAGYVDALVREGSLKAGHKKGVKGYVMHGYHEYQPRRSEVMKRSRMRSEVGRQGGVRSGETRKQRAEANPNQVASTLLNPVSSRLVPSRPVLKESESTPPLLPEANGHVAASVDWGEPEHLIALYNQLVPEGHPRVQRSSPGRIAKSRKYLRIFPERAFWVRVFSEIRFSAHLRGQRPSPGHEHFTGNFDWLLTKGKDETENCVKVSEGKFRDKAHAG